MKEDLVELSKIKYGLFNVDEWKGLLSNIITKKIEEFDVGEANKEVLRKKITDFLNVVLADFEDRYYEENSSSLSGLFKSAVAKVTSTFDHMKKDIPKFADQIVNFLDEEKNREALRGYILDRIDDYADRTFAETDYTSYNEILSKYGFSERSEVRQALMKDIESINKQVRPWKIGLLVIAFIIGILLIYSSGLTKIDLLIASVISFVFLIIGLYLPMIEIDARISNMKLQLLGESVSFYDQVLFYKSKSILEVVALMMTKARLDLIFVGLLVLCFSVLFPISKLISSVIYIFNEPTRKRPFIQFMVFKTGKWSMADVLVIAIFMAYIGFDGIITEQMNQVESMMKNLDILTTNNSALLFGFFAFTAFVILSLLISQRIDKVAMARKLK